MPQESDFLLNKPLKNQMQKRLAWKFWLDYHIVVIQTGTKEKEMQIRWVKIFRFKR